ncbi:hypothetical protein ARALYDRAFT_901150 [Arabidopsis lyrata subsp. lyrata]|uniref:Uncharacterized protein n=1 Tax=Arabidopsis lyrata subsp. lyrata TaxID=81972 RepID=D7LKL6_ARALL|nr:hypothetical protein ARALYDRAFT_901150 [Arabidopsis lyrata subsp. lyrata]
MVVKGDGNGIVWFVVGEKNLRSKLRVIVFWRRRVYWRNCVSHNQTDKKKMLPTRGTELFDDYRLTKLDLCFKLPNAVKNIDVPKMIFILKVWIWSFQEKITWWWIQSPAFWFFAMGSSIGMSVFENVQQLNFNVLHDLEKETVSCVPTKCGKL